MQDFVAVKDIVQADIFLDDFDNVDGSMIGEFERRSVGSRLELYGYYFILVTFALSPIITLSSKPIVVHRLINSSKELNTSRDI